MRILRALAWTAGSLAAVLLLFAFTVLMRPSLILNSRTAAKTIRHFGKAYHPSWASLSFEIGSPGLLTKELRLDARELCFAQKDFVRGCVKKIEVRARLRLGIKGLEEIDLEDLSVQGRYLRVDWTKKPVSATKPKSTFESGVRFPSLLPNRARSIHLGTISADLPDDSIRLSSASRIQGSAKVEFDPKAGGPMRLVLNALWKTPQEARRLRAGARIGSDAFAGRELSSADVSAWLTESTGIRASLEARLRRQEVQKATLELRARIGARSGRASAHLRVTQTAFEYQARGELSLLDPSSPVPSLHLENCSFRAPLKQGTTQPRGLDLGCRYWLEPAAFVQETRGLSALKRLSGALRLRADLSGRPTQRDFFTADARITLEPARSWYELFGEARAQVSGRLHDLRHGLKIRHSVNLVLRSRFEDLAAFLVDTPYEIPAPINVLRGPLSFDLFGAGNGERDIQRLNLRFSSNLHKGFQDIKLDVSGRLLARRPFEPARSLEADIDVALTEVSLELPFLRLQKPPQVAVDKRIITKDQVLESRASPRMPVSLVVRVHTPARPVTLYSNLIKDPVPIKLDMNVRWPPTAMDGIVSLQKFQVELFKRIATVDHARLSFHPNSKAADLAGDIVYKAPEATIHILLLGSTEKPRVDFLSDPPLDRQQILALLIYGKSPNDLDPDQTATVSNTDSALAGEAFGLASLYLFASTPIEYVGFDPTTQTYSIKLRLPGGATMELGSNLEQARTLTVRKQLAPHWEIQTELSNAAGQGNTVTTFLEWFNRY